GQGGPAASHNSRLDGRTGGGGGRRGGGRGGGGGEEDDDDDSDDDDEEEEGRGGEGQEGAPGTVEMTVAAVRGSLLRNGSEGDREDGAAPNPDREVEEWEVVVKKFIRHVESLPRGTEQEELSLMFAAALDPTLVRMRAANTALVRLAEAC
ncbi:unnamed protein product, partial [Hapterophycus canaliculatus]